LFTAQAGGELTDLIIVLRTDDAVKTFSGNMHISLGAGLSAALGIVGRSVEADVRAGDGGYAACYTYSCSKGMLFVIMQCTESLDFFNSVQLDLLFCHSM